MFLKVLVSLFSIIALLKNISYSIYEYKNNKNYIGCVSIIALSLLSFVIINTVMFFIKF